MAAITETRSTVELDNIYNSLILGKIPSLEKPKCIIAYGPPASGKGFITQKIKTDFGIADNTLIDVNVDTAIGKIPEYIEEIKTCVTNFSKYYSENVPIDDEKIKNLTSECVKIYFKYRSNGDYITNKLLEHSLANKINFIFETTGLSIDWTLSNVVERAKKMGFETILFFPVVNSDVIIKRLYSRASVEGRMPSPDFVISMMGKAHANFATISKAVDKLYVYNNNATTKLVLTIDNGTKICNFTDLDAKELNDPLIGVTVDKLKTECPLPITPPTVPMMGGSKRIYKFKNHM